MQIINVRDNENNRRKRREKNKGVANHCDGVRGKWFCCVFKLGFVQLMSKASLIFKSNLESALSITLKEREL